MLFPLDSMWVPVLLCAASLGLRSLCLHGAFSRRRSEQGQPQNLDRVSQNISKNVQHNGNYLLQNEYKCVKLLKDFYDVAQELLKISAP